MLFSLDSAHASAAKAKGDITAHLQRWSAGDAHALDALFPLVYKELRRMAAGHMRDEWSQHTLSPTGLVHEAYERLSRQPAMDTVLASRDRFLAWASTLMRHIMVDHARARQADKRGAGMRAHSLEQLQEQGLDTPGSVSADVETAAYVLALDQALTRLDAVDPAARQVVECRFFGGLSVDETAQALQMSASSVKRDWISARTWLLRELRGIRHAHGAWATALAQAR
jgi:RNA polymerase sigma factor (TIGR02999 family)